MAGSKRLRAAPPRRRYRKRVSQPFALDLGPGDPGYRLRPGASGFDPFETYQETGRVFGLLLRDFLTGRAQPAGLPLLIGLLAGFFVIAALGSFWVWYLMLVMDRIFEYPRTFSQFAWLVSSGFVIAGALIAWYWVFRLATALSHRIAFGGHHDKSVSPRRSA
jgi:hypothetical protein